MFDPKTTKFIRQDNAMDWIRREILKNEGNAKIIEFKIDSVQISFLNSIDDIDVKSDEIIEQEKRDFSEKHVFYEWENNVGFQKAER